MQITTKITFVGFLLAVATVSVSAVASTEMSNNKSVTGKIEHRLSRITEAMQQRDIQSLDTFGKEGGQQIAGGFGNRVGGGGFGNVGGGGGFANRGGGSGGFANVGGGGGGFVNRSPWTDRGSFFNR
ncbi:GrrA/OscA1 family cyclophane-containing rSAM-modified RiPP [Crocosphaera sp. XPORK-15E]|uniref:GrrA/OscA1 family cyclophane-containing rSAM-modified RiPP n=1 Tax=Crocosphaera sp. XPORK-15E TaxID=3110247 RepID=UPI002B2055C4|nr:GrrA/OscA1 family cyclophane-containing rSAM-modified RiPP [Crocosphaera sp. XPORK-15E]MEA5536343.1 GrrA/OscA1 family cyclophane-containing rSAM-modified RiPP [Crocosphaera sp. XPORK-15E]